LAHSDLDITAFTLAHSDLDITAFTLAYSDTTPCRYQALQHCALERTEFPSAPRIETPHEYFWHPQTYAFTSVNFASLAVFLMTPYGSHDYAAAYFHSLSHSPAMCLLSESPSSNGPLPGDPSYELVSYSRVPPARARAPSSQRICPKPVTLPHAE
jgi:hypothetical protein